jgi:hypothetical protein
MCYAMHLLAHIKFISPWQMKDNSHQIEIDMFCNGISGDEFVKWSDSV